MKFFSLIRGDEVHRAEESKVLPASVFSALVDAKELLEQVKADALRYRQDTAEEVERLKEVAQQEGFQQGVEEWAEQLRRLEEEIHQVNERVEKVILPVALQAARKVVGREITLNPETIADIVATNLKAVAGHQRVTIYCNREDLQHLKGKKGDLEQLFERLESLSVEERDDIQQGGCIIETEAGIINAQPDQVWSTLEAAFETIWQQP